MSKPNSWSAPPISKGAMSRMGKRDGLFVLYSMIVLPHSLFFLCKRRLIAIVIALFPILRIVSPTWIISEIISY